MKRISIVILLLSVILFGNAQNNVPSLRGNKQNKSNTEQTQQDNKEQTEKRTEAEETTAEPVNREVPSLNPQAPSAAKTSARENRILESAVENAFLVVRADYNIRDKENGTNISGNEFFGTVYSVVPLLAYGYGVDNRFLNPWKSDPNYDANKYGENLVSVDKLQYRRLKDKDFIPFDMNKTTSETLASGFYNVLDTTFHNQGLGIELGNGMKSGFMVWFYADESGETSQTIIPTTITFNENTIFNVRQPADATNVIGGAFLNMNVDEPGCIRLNLMGIARMDPYGTGKWELVKMLAQPANSANADASSNDKKSGEDDAIIPDKDNKNDKGKSKKEKSK